MIRISPAGHSPADSLVVVVEHPELPAKTADVRTKRGRLGVGVGVSTADCWGRAGGTRPPAGFGRWSMRPAQAFEIDTTGPGKVDQRLNVARFFWKNQYQSRGFDLAAPLVFLFHRRDSPPVGIPPADSHVRRNDRQSVGD